MIALTPTVTRATMRAMVLEWLKALGPVLGSLSAALVTGVLLVYQSNRNARREAENRQRDLVESRRREDVTAREAWAAVFQEGLITLERYLNHDDEDKVLEVLEARVLAVEMRVLPATARFMVVERDENVRARAQALSDSFQKVFSPSERPDYFTTQRRFVALKDSFFRFLDRLAGVGPVNPTERLKNSLLHSGLSPDKVRELEEEIDAAAAGIVVPAEPDGRDPKVPV